ncbi:MAG TPA: hypothetical protein VGP47_07280, partial [Parachlamydiaceae bacterium]|nr:hypothetical protein [Parachlamydiaceae bacterium]
MLYTILFTVVFTIFSSLGFAQVLIEDFFSSSPEQIVTLTESRDFLIGNVIHPLSGQPCLRQLDLVAKGAQSIELKRTFISNYTPLNEKKGQLYPSNSSYGGWVYFPHTHLNVFRKSEIKFKRNIITETIVSVADPFGAVLSYEITNSGKTYLKTRPWGLSNGVDDNPSGQYDPRNTSISIDGTMVVLKASDGTKRFYKTSDTYQLDLNKDRYTCLYCLLQKEILPNGKVLRYQYNKERQVIKVESLDPQEQYIYATLDINCSIYSDKATLTTNTGSQSVNYHNTAPYYNGNQGRCVDLLYPLRFTTVSSPLFRDEISKYYTNRSNNSWLTEYSGKNSIFMCKHVRMPKKGKEEGTLQVSELSFPGETNDYHPIYTMQYKRGLPGKAKSTTTVTHCDGIKTIYEFNAKMLPESIKYFDQSGSLIKTKAFEWTYNQWLKSITIFDSQQEVMSKKEFEYDSFGNPLSEIFTGDLTGNGQIESTEIKRIFSLDGRNLLLEEEFSNGKVISYTYLQETNLLTSRFIKENKKTCLSREFREYDDSYNLIKIIEDDGSADKAENLSDVSQRIITNFKLRQQPPFLHMPEWIEVNYLENGIEKLQKRTQIVYDVHGNISQEHVYNSDNNFAYTITKKYDEKGCLLSETNALGQQAVYTYDAYGKEKSSKSFSNNLLRSSHYDPKGRIKKIRESGKDGMVREYEFFHDLKDRLIKKTNNFNHSTLYKHDLVANKPIQIETPQLFTADGKALSVIDKSSYDALGRKTISIDAKDNATKYRYNSYSSVTEIIYPDQSKETFLYTKSGLLDSHTLPCGRVISYLYDVLGNVISKSYSMKDQLIGQELFEYKGDILLKSYDLEGHATVYEYDSLGRKIREEKYGNTTTYHYDSLGNIDIICKENGTNSLYTHLRHDLLGRVLEKRITDAEGTLLTLLSYSYDGDGNVHTFERNINDKEAIDTYAYDSFNRQTSHKDALGHLTFTEYNEKFVNASGQQVLKKTVKDPRQCSTVEIQDPYGRIAKIEKLNSSNQIISAEEQSYDVCGNPVLHTDHVYHDTNFIASKSVQSTYDSCNRLKTITRAFETPDARITEFTYHPGGKVATKTMPDGISLNYSYDALDHLKSIYSSDGSLSQSFTYNLNGQLLVATDESQKLTVQRTLDPNGNVVFEELSTGINIKKSYDNFNRLLSISLPDGGKVAYTYDPLYLKSVKRLSSSEEMLYEHCYDAFDTSGYLTKESLIATLGTVSHDTDALGQSIKISSEFFTQKNRYDEVGNIVEQVVNDVNKEFAYDDLSQLISESDHEYKYDSTFNRIEDSGEACRQNDLDEQVSIGNLQCSYDLRGNLIGKSTHEQTQKFSYDVLNRLTDVVKNNKKTSFIYDPLGRRIGKSQYTLTDNEWNEVARESVFYDGNNDIGTLSATGDVKELRVLGLGVHPEKLTTIAIELNGKVYAPLLDSHGNIRSLIDTATKIITATYDYNS